MTTADTIERANQAKRLLDDPTLQKAFAGVREALVQRMEAAAIGDDRTHHSLVQQLQALREIQRQLHKWFTDGEVERLRQKKD